MNHARMTLTLDLADSLNQFGERMSAIQFLEEVNSMLALPQSAMARTVLLAKQKKLEYELETWCKLQSNLKGL